MNFHRYYIPDSAVFITQVVQDRAPIFRDPNRLDLLLETIHNAMELHPFIMLGYVFLFDHFHMIHPAYWGKQFQRYYALT